MLYIDDENAIKADGFYSVTVSDNKNNKDNISITSFRIGDGSTIPPTGDTVALNLVLAMLFGSAAFILISMKVLRKRGRGDRGIL